MNNLRRFLILTLFIFSISTVLAVCEEGQIDINSASKEDLMKITGLGGEGIVAQRVIDNRPFSSLDDLTKVSGIKESKLAAIKSQNLACVADEEITNEEVNNTISNISEEELGVVEVNNSAPRNIDLQMIDLTPKAIKSEGNSEDLGKNNYAIYGLVAFSILLVGLFALKNRKKRNELA